jgi:predicted RND superfamily exporter protein
MSRVLARVLLGPPGRRVALALGVLALVALGGVARLTLDNRIERWLSASSATAADHDRFQSLFGDDAFVLVAYGRRDPLSEEALSLGLSVAETLERAPHVTAVLGPPVLHRDVFDGENPEALRDLLLDTPFYRRFIVSEDGSVAGLLLATDLGDDPGAPRALVTAVWDAVAPLEAAGFDVHLAGPPTLNVALDEASRREAQRSFPPCFALSIVLLAALLRCVRTTAVAVACAATTILLTFGALGWAGISLNMVTSVLPSLLWVLSLAGAVHLLRRFQVHHGAGLECEAALEAAWSETARPCLTAGVTTAAGFASLLAASMAPVRELGAFAALGLLFSVAANLTLAPVLVRWLRPPARPRAGRAYEGALARLPFRYGSAVLLGALALSALALVGIRRIEVDSDPLAFLPADARVVRDYDAVARDLTGYYALEVMLDAPDGWQHASVWRELERIEAALAALPGVARVLSPLDGLRQLNALEGDGYGLPRDEARGRALLADFGGFVQSEGFPLLADEGRVVRLAALVNVMPSSVFGPIERAAEDAVAALPPPLSGVVTGVVPRLVEAQLALVDTQLRSFGVAFLTIFACLWIGLRSFRAVAISVVPNLFPIAVALGAMGFAGIALDAATVMMASVALGIAVDDTVHVLSAWEEERGRERQGAARRALARTGPALFITTAAACVGFLALWLSDFLPIRWFGLLSALAIAVALLADAWLLPAVLVRLEERAA